MIIVTVTSALIMMSVWNITNMEFPFGVQRDDKMAFSVGSTILNKINPILPEQTRAFQDPWNNFHLKCEGERKKKNKRNEVLSCCNNFELVWKLNVAPTFCLWGNRFYCVFSWVSCGCNRMAEKVNILGFDFLCCRFFLYFTYAMEHSWYFRYVQIET